MTEWNEEANAADQKICIEKMKENRRTNSKHAPFLCKDRN